MTNSSIFKFSKTPTHQDMDSEFFGGFDFQTSQSFLEVFLQHIFVFVCRTFHCFFPMAGCVLLPLGARGAEKHQSSSSATPCVEVVSPEIFPAILESKMVPQEKDHCKV